MTVRIIVYGLEGWRRDVLKASSDGRYLTLVCASQPSPVSYLFGATSFLICADDQVTQALRDEYKQQLQLWRAKHPEYDRYLDSILQNCRTLRAPQI